MIWPSLSSCNSTSITPGLIREWKILLGYLPYDVPVHLHVFPLFLQTRTELQIRGEGGEEVVGGGIEDNSKIIFVISQ